MIYFVYLAKRETGIAFLFPFSFSLPWNCMLMIWTVLWGNLPLERVGYGMGGRMKAKEVLSDLHLMNHPLPIFYFFPSRHTSTREQQTSYLGNKWGEVILRACWLVQLSHQSLKNPNIQLRPTSTKYLWIQEILGLCFFPSPWKAWYLKALRGIQVSTPQHFAPSSLWASKVHADIFSCFLLLDSDMEVNKIWCGLACVCLDRFT